MMATTENLNMLVTLSRPPLFLSTTPFHFFIVLQNKMVKKQRSLEKLKAIAWGESGRRVRSRAEYRQGGLSATDQVSDCIHSHHTFRGFFRES